MANELQIITSLTVTNGYGKDVFDFGTIQVNQDDVGGPTPGYVTIGTSEESQAFSELGTLGWLAMRNLDVTNFVEWGFSTGVYGGRLEPGETAVFRLNPSTTLYLKADTAACKMVIKAFED